MIALWDKDIIAEFREFVNILHTSVLHFYQKLHLQVLAYPMGTCEILCFAPEELEIASGAN
jgi:hypothetical protein